MINRKALLYYLLVLKIHSTKSDEIEITDENRRFLEDLDDEEWHISHLRNLENVLEDCEGETFLEKAKRYRKSLKNDGALVEFVSYNNIPFNPYAVESNKCKANTSTKHKLNSSSDNLNTTNIKMNKGNDGEVKSATISTKGNLKEPERMSENKTQRRSEYQFSSVEYYDEVQDFDPSVCPDDVEVITLELDQLRNYYVECESIIEWRSLEDHK